MKRKESSFGYPLIDEVAANCWVYPTNYPIRDYQLQISKQALFTNTLVCLPTGLGKTLIATVVMYNFYRWYPNGSVVFLAPTRPLVAQQWASFRDVFGGLDNFIIPSDSMVQLDGSTDVAKRETLWNKCRIVYCTPQVFLNDMTNKKFDAKKVVCVVVDEAHKATENYAYTTVIKALSNESNNFRVLALSATPGSDARKIQNVVTNLLISHIEYRTEEDPEVAPYTHDKEYEVIRCAAGKDQAIEQLKQALNAVIDGILEPLMMANVFPTETSASSINPFSFEDAER